MNASRRQRLGTSLSLRVITTCVFFIVVLPEHIAFVIPATSKPVSFRRYTSSKNANEQMKLLQNKLDILQDVVKKVQSTNQNLTSALVQQEEELTSKLRAEEQKRIEADAYIKRLQLELNQTQSELVLQASQYTKSMEKLEEKYAQDCEEWKERTRQAQKQSQVLQDKIRALQREVLDMDQSLETTQAELITAQKRWATRENELRSVSEVHERNIQALEEKLKKLRLEKDSLEKGLDAQNTSEEERRESIEIASAAVRAAEKREEGLRMELESLQKKVVQLEAKQNASDQKRVKEQLKELEAERIKYSQERERYRQEYEKKLDAQRETYEAELRLFRVNNTMDEAATKIDTSSAASDGLPQASSTTGRRRIWKRLRSLFRGKRQAPHF